MARLGAAFEPPDMQTAMGEVDGVPAQRHQLGCPQPVPVGDQHHGGIAVAVAIPPGCIDQAGNLAISEVLAGADLGVTFAARGVPAIANCPNNGGWGPQRQLRICHDYSRLSSCNGPKQDPSRESTKGEKRRFYKHNFDLGAAAKLVSRQETLNWRAFCVGGQSTPTAAKGGNAQWRTAIHPRDGGLRFTGE